MFITAYLPGRVGSVVDDEVDADDEDDGEVDDEDEALLKRGAARGSWKT